MEELLTCLVQGDYARCEAAARAELARGGPPVLWWFIAHALIRTGDFGGGLAALAELEAKAPAKADMARYYVDYARRELQENLAVGAPARLAELRARDDWQPLCTEAVVADAAGDLAVARAIVERPQPPVAGRVVFEDDRTARFDDLRDTHDLVGRHLPVYLPDRTTHLAFATIRSITFAPERVLEFDDLWVPVEIRFRPGAARDELTARVPSCYPGWPAGAAPVKAGRTTLFDHTAGYRRAQGRRDYELVVGGSTVLTGLLQLRRIDFDA